MQEFGPFEQDIITHKLIPGSTLREMLSKDFNDNSRLEIQVDTSEEHHVFSFYSDSYDAQLAVEELVNIVDLLSTLEENGLIRKYFKAATNMDDFDVTERIEIGNSKSDKRARFVLPVAASEGVVLYLYKNLDKTYKATQKLRSIVANNFESIEVRHHKQLVGLTRMANLISFLSAGAAVAALIISLLPANVDSINLKIESIERQVTKLNNSIAADSANGLSNERELQRLKNRMDSIRHSLRTVKKKK